MGAFLKTDDWNYRFDKETGRFRFGLNTNNKLKTLEYLVGVDTDTYTVYAYLPRRCGCLQSGGAGGRPS